MNSIPYFFTHGVTAIPFSLANPYIISHFQFATASGRMQLEKNNVTKASGMTDMWRNNNGENDGKLKVFCDIAKLAFTQYGPRITYLTTGKHKYEFGTSPDHPLNCIGSAIMNYHSNKSYKMTDVEIETTNVIKNRENDGDESWRKTVLSGTTKYITFVNGILAKFNKINKLPRKTLDGILYYGDSCHCDDLTRGVYPLFTYVIEQLALKENMPNELNINGIRIELVPVSLALKNGNGALMAEMINTGLPVYRDESHLFSSKAVYGYPLSSAYHTHYIFSVLRPLLGLYTGDVIPIGYGPPYIENDFSRDALKLSENRHGIEHCNPGVHGGEDEVIRYFDANAFFPSLMQNLNPYMEPFIGLLKQTKENAAGESERKLAKHILLCIYGGSKHYNTRLYNAVGEAANVVGMYIVGAASEGKRKPLLMCKDGVIYKGPRELESTTLHKDIQSNIPYKHISFKDEGTYDRVIISFLHKYVLISKGSPIKCTGIHSKANPPIVRDVLNEILNRLASLLLDEEPGQFSLTSRLDEIVQFIVNRIKQTEPVTDLEPLSLEQYVLPSEAKGNKVDVLTELRDFSWVGDNSDERKIPLGFGNSRYIYIKCKYHKEDPSTWAYSVYNKGILAYIHHNFTKSPLDTFILDVCRAQANHTTAQEAAREIKGFFNEKIVNRGVVAKDSLLLESHIDWIKYVYLVHKSLSQILVTLLKYEQQQPQQQQQPQREENDHKNKIITAFDKALEREIELEIAQKNYRPLKECQQLLKKHTKCFAQDSS